MLRTNRKRTTETDKTLAAAPVAWPNNRIFRQLPFFSVKQKAKLPHLNFWIKTPILRQVARRSDLLQELLAIIRGSYTLNASEDFAEVFGLAEPGASRDLRDLQIGFLKQ